MHFRPCQGDVLTFFGLGLVDDPSRGQMLNQVVQASTFNWWLAVFPGGVIFRCLR